MLMKLPINIEELLGGKAGENDRIETSQKIAQKTSVEMNTHAIIVANKIKTKIFFMVKKYFPHLVLNVKEFFYLCARKRIKENKEE